MSWESTLTHLGIYHEKLFQALDHNKKFKIDSVLKRLFPKKYARHNRSKKAKKSPDSGERKVGQNSSNSNGHRSPASNGHKPPPSKGHKPSPSNGHKSPSSKGNKSSPSNGHKPSPSNGHLAIEADKAQEENTPSREDDDDRPQTSLSGELQGREWDDTPPPSPTKRRTRRRSISTSDSSVNEQVLHII